MGTKPDLITRLKNGDVLVSDGATGTNLQKRGLEKGESPERWIMEKPDMIHGLYTDFVTSGSDIILTCTFGASPTRLLQHHLDECYVEINRQAVALAQQAVSEFPVYIGGSIGPLGQLLQPLGTLSTNDALSAIRAQAEVLIEANVDLVVIETQFDLVEATLAIQAVREVSPSIPLVCSFSFDRGKRTMMGVRPEQFAEEIGKLPVDILGINCGRSLEENFEVLQLVHSASQRLIWFKPNAGLPTVDEAGNSVYSISPDDMSARVPAWIAAGASIVGGCCGTSPAHLKAIATVAHARN
ncbi:MAG: homocysteine S-methyltransferase family protein [Anaerolineae bacterium]|nr:homocysteine S-methyltransferase family protein [Anaerolineae bacterium]